VLAIMQETIYALPPVSLDALTAALSLQPARTCEKVPLEPIDVLLYCFTSLLLYCFTALLLYCFDKVLIDESVPAIFLLLQWVFACLLALLACFTGFACFTCRWR
jgi:hypothetical protein